MPGTPCCLLWKNLQKRASSEGIQSGKSKAQVATDVWEKDVWDFQAKSGSSGSCPLFPHFLGKIAVQKMSGKTPGSPRQPSCRHPRLSEKAPQTATLEVKIECGQKSIKKKKISTQFPTMFLLTPCAEISQHKKKTK